MLKNLVGAWKFLSSEMTDEYGTSLPDPVNEGTGLLLYTQHYMSAQLSMPQLGKGLVQDYIAYSGSYTFDADRQIVTHHIEIANFPKAVVTSVEREVHYIDDNKMTLRNVQPEKYGSDVTIFRKLLWEKIDGVELRTG